ncbi:MAG: nuclear transport factor 2 family protein [Comamonadaceae bacterium]|nr:nuclear transport factor 2 family protein [Comamonadaceae bacterium]
MSGRLDHFKDTFNRLNGNTLDLLAEIYTPDVVFRDPVHELKGLPALRDYYGRLYQGVVSCQFEFEDEVIGDQQGMLVWLMRFQHRPLSSRRNAKIARGEPPQVPERRRSVPAPRLLRHGRIHLRAGASVGQRDSHDQKPTLIGRALHENRHHRHRHLRA